MEENTNITVQDTHTHTHTRKHGHGSDVYWFSGEEGYEHISSRE